MIEEVGRVMMGNQRTVLSEVALGRATQVTQVPKVVSEAATPVSSLSKAIPQDERERAVLREALNRGAGIHDLAELLYRYRYRKRPAPNQLPHASFPSINQLDGPLLESETDQETWGAFYESITIEVKAYVMERHQEFTSLPQGVRASFGKAGEAFEHYLNMWSMYYNLGYRNPATSIFRRILVGVELLGHKVQGGLHEEFVKRAAPLRDTLNNLLKGLFPDLDLASITAKEIHSVAGFVPRFIAGTSVLSNHAFGLAIDIDPEANPHIKGSALAVLNAAVKEKGIEWDFGKKYFERAAVISDATRLAAVYLAATSASKWVQSWLQEHLPTYKLLQDELAAAQRILKTTRPGSEEYQKAKETIEAAKKKIREDQNLARLQIINTDGHPLKEMEQWSLQGIQNIPLSLAVALGQLHFGWGQDWKSSKDGMHFELEAKVVLPPDSPPHQGLEDLL